jgi:hypothetical protein
VLFDRRVATIRLFAPRRETRTLAHGPRCVALQVHGVVSLSVESGPRLRVLVVPVCRSQRLGVPIMEQ